MIGSMKMKATTRDAYILVHKGVLSLARAERQGIRIDIEYCENQRKKLTRKIDYYQKKLAGTKFYKRWQYIYREKTNVYSNDQLSNVLYKHMKIDPPKFTESGQGATDEEALKRLGISELNWIIEMRKLAKIRDTYLEQFIRETNKDGYMRPFFNLHTVRTFRSSSSDPNFQNIPKRDKEAMRICRRAILPRPGHMLVEADFSALEVMIGACYHKDPIMMKYLHDKNSDMHSDMAKQIFFLETLDKSIPTHNLLRQAAKNGFVFPQFYGDYYANNAQSICEWVKLPINKGEKRWSRNWGMEFLDGTTIAEHFWKNGIKSFNDFVEHMRQVEDDFWNRRFRVYQQWKDDWVAQYQQKGYLEMLTGFRCSGVMRKNEIINYPIQGSAFHCLLFTFIQLDQIIIEKKWDSKLVGQIHDSIVIDANPEEVPLLEEALIKIVKEELPRAWKWIIVPLEIEVDVYGIDKPWLKD